MVGEERDARLILRAEDRATKTFDQVAKSIANVREALKAQTKAAEGGQGSLDDLKRSLQELSQAGEDLIRQQSAITAFEKQGAAAELAAERVAKASAAYEAYQQKLAASDKITERQADKLERLGRAVETASTALNKSNQRLDGAREKLIGLGLSAENAQQQFDEIGNQARLVAQGMAQATVAIDGYDAAVKRAAVDAHNLAEEQKFLKDSARTGITAADIGVVRDFTEANAKLREEETLREREAAASAAATVARRKSLQAAVNQQLEGSAQLNESFEQLAREEKELASANAFRKIASDAAAASADLNRFGQTSTAATASLTRLADSVRQIVSPTLAEVTTLDGALKQIDASATLAANKQKLRVSQYQDALNQLSQAQAGLVRQAQGIDAYRVQEQALQRLEIELGDAALKVDHLAATLAKVPHNADEVVRELKAAENELERVGLATQAAGTKLEGFRLALQRAGIDVDNLADVEARLVTGARQAATASDILQKKVGGNGKGFLGLKSYELTNLGYQINDVFTSLASGIPITQTLAQQGPQIVQLFPSLLAGALRLLPILAPIAAGLGLVAYQLYQTKRAADAIRGFDALFTLGGNAAGLSAKQFGEAQIALERLGAKADEAKDALRTFIKEGLDPSGLDAFVKTAKTLADVTGESLPQAASKLADAYSKGYDQVTALNDITGVLSQTQLDEIKNLFDAGKAVEARTLAQEAFTKAAQTTSDKSKTEWQRTTSGLANAFRDLNDAFRLSAIGSAVANGVYAVLIKTLQDITGVVNGVATAFNFAKRVIGTAGSFLTGVNLNQADPASPGKPKTTDAKPKARTSEGQRFLDQQQVELRNAKELTQAERLRNAEVEGRRAAEKAGLKDADVLQAGLNAKKIEQGKIDKENASSAKKGISDANKAQREAETRQNAINALTLDLRNTYLSFADVGTVDPFKKIQDDAEKAVNTIRDKFDKLAKLGVYKVDGKSRNEFEVQVTAYAAIQTQQATLKKNEDDLNALLEARKQRLAAIEDQVNRGQLTPLEGLEASKTAIDETTVSIRTLADGALAFAQALYAAKPDPKLAAEITRIKGVLSSISGEEAQSALRNIGKADLKAAQDQLNALVTQRDDYIRLQNELAKAGLKTTTDAQNAIKVAYNDSSPAILAQAAAVEKVIAKLVQLKALTPEQAAVAQGQVDLVKQQTQYLDEDITALRQAALNALSGSVADFIGNLGSQIADVISGTSNLGDALKGIAGAALQFAASFTKAIAQAIVQLVALKVAKAALNAIGFLGGGFHDGGVIGVDQPTFRRRVPAEVFAGAIRYHTGGVVGLKPDEVPAILQKGEEVVTADDPRHRRNGGGGGAQQPVQIKNINLFDAGEAVSQGANTTLGEKAILNVISRNPSAVRAALG